MDLHNAINDGSESRVREALKNADITALNALDSEGRTPLLLAAEKGEWELVKPLLSKPGIKLDFQDKTGRTPLSWAIAKNLKPLVEALLKSQEVDPNKKDNNGDTPLFWAATNGSLPLVNLLLESDKIKLDTQDKDGRTALSRAVEKCLGSLGQGLASNTLEIANCVAKVDPHIKDNNDRTAIFWAAGAKSDMSKIVKKTLCQSLGIDIKSKDKEGWTPFWWALKKEDWELAEEMLHLTEVDLNETRDGQTPAQWLIKNGVPESRTVLLGTIQPGFRDIDGRGLLSWAAEHGNLFTIETLLTKNVGELNDQDRSGRTPLMWSLGNDNQEVATLLLQSRNIKVNQRDMDGRTALSLAAEQGNLSAVEQLLKWNRFRDGFDVKIDPNRADSLGRTPLHYAISARPDAVLHVEVASAIASCGATDVNIKDDKGITPLKLAIEKRRHDLIMLLLDKSALTTGITVNNWREAYDKQKSDDIVLLLERNSSVKSIEFITSCKFLEAPDWTYTEYRTDRRLFMVSNKKSWPSELTLVDLHKLGPQELTAQIQHGDNGRDDIISIAVSFPTDIDLEQQGPTATRDLDWDACGIAWTMRQGSDGKPLAHITMMPVGSIPTDDIDFFTQFVVYLQERWLRRCTHAKDHLATRRLHQLHYEGQNPEVIRRLAKDALKWTGFRSDLKSQIIELQAYIVEYGQRYGTGRTPDMQQALRGLEQGVTGRINDLDQTVRDLLQIEFAWVSMREAKISGRLGQNVMLLTYVSIFYLPLGFCAALWAIPDITSSTTQRPFIITAVVTGLITFLVAFNLKIILRMYYALRTYLIQGMQNDDDLEWSRLGVRLQGSESHQDITSEWWLLIFPVYKGIKKVVRTMGKQGKQGDMESASDSYAGESDLQVANRHATPTANP